MVPKPARGILRWWLRVTGFHGITLPPWGIYILVEYLASERLVRHEKAHWFQYQRMGAVRFYLTYIWGWVRHGYRNHPMEIEARNAECPPT
jgi:hypothetical protein